MLIVDADADVDGWWQLQIWQLWWHMTISVSMTLHWIQC